MIIKWINSILKPKWIDLKKNPGNTPGSGKIVIGVMIYKDVCRGDKRFVFDFWGYDNEKKQWYIVNYDRTMQESQRKSYYNVDKMNETLGTKIEYQSYTGTSPNFWIDIEPPVKGMLSK